MVTDLGVLATVVVVPGEAVTVWPLIGGAVRFRGHPGEAGQPAAPRAPGRRIVPAAAKEANKTTSNVARDAWTFLSASGHVPVSAAWAPKAAVRKRVESTNKETKLLPTAAWTRPSVWRSTSRPGDCSPST